MFLTPIFNIKTINVTGNSKLSTEQITAQIDYVSGKNLFRTGKRGIRKKLSELAYVENVIIKKRPFPPSLTVQIEECKPLCQLAYADAFIITKTEKFWKRPPKNRREYLFSREPQSFPPTRANRLPLRTRKHKKLLYRA